MISQINQIKKYKQKMVDYYTHLNENSDTIPEKEKQFFMIGGKYGKDYNADKI